MHSASDVVAAWSPTSTILSSRIRLRSNDESMPASASALSPLQSEPSIVIGWGSASFEMIRALVERLPVMITPRAGVTKMM